VGFRNRRYSTWRNRLYWFLRSQGCPDSDIEDVIQESIEIVRLKWDSILAHDKVKAYWYTVALRRMRRVQYQRRRLATVDPKEYLQAAGDPTDQISEHEARRAAVELVKRLPPKQRAVFWLRAIEDLSEEETADILRVSVGTVKSNYSDARKNLEKLHREAGGNSGGGH
jgi:RNA polymerase sigma factor (sigma-70 family)